MIKTIALIFGLAASVLVAMKLASFIEHDGCRLAGGLIEAATGACVLSKSMLAEHATYVSLFSRPGLYAFWAKLTTAVFIPGWAVFWLVRNSISADYTKVIKHSVRAFHGMMLFTLFGPPIGGIVITCLAAILDTKESYSISDRLIDIPTLLPLVVMMSYYFGALPAAITGVVVSRVPLGLNPHLFGIASGVVGLLVSGVSLGYIGFEITEIAEQAWVKAYIPGFVGSAMCARMFLWRKPVCKSADAQQSVQADLP